MFSGSQDFLSGELEEQKIEIITTENKIAAAIINYLNNDVPVLSIDDQYFTDRGKHHADYDQITKQFETTLKHAHNLRNAALICFDLVRTLALSKQDVIEAHIDILKALKDEKLSLMYMNKIFSYLLGRDELVKVNTHAEHSPVPAPSSSQKAGFFSSAVGLTNSVRQYAGATLNIALGSLYSPEWQDTMSKTRHFALKRLQVELKAMMDDYDQIKYLEAAKTMPIFNEHQSNSVLTGAYGNTRAVSVINGVLQELRAKQSLSNSIKM